LTLERRPRARPVILSVAKDLIAACHGHEILRYAQDDKKARPDLKTSKQKVLKL
jgi:hypothetical protein